MKIELRCYFCRKKFSEVHLNVKPKIPVCYDFCPSCDKSIMEQFEKQFQRKYLKQKAP